MSEFVTKECIPSVDELNQLRMAVGWGAVDQAVLSVSLNNTLYGVSVKHNGNIVGSGRIIGDGALYFYIQDVIVLPEYQRQGIGKIVMQHLMNYLQENCPLHSFVGLMAAKGKHLFYERYGFIVRPNEIYGPGMTMVWPGK